MTSSMPDFLSPHRLITVMTMGQNSTAHQRRPPQKQCILAKHRFLTRPIKLKIGLIFSTTNSIVHQTRYNRQDINHGPSLNLVIMVKRFRRLPPHMPHHQSYQESLSATTSPLLPQSFQDQRLSLRALSMKIMAKQKLYLINPRDLFDRARRVLPSV